MCLLETRNLGQCVWKLMTVCLPAFVECVREARQRRKRARAVLDIRDGERRTKQAEFNEGKEKRNDLEEIHRIFSN